MFQARELILAAAGKRWHQLALVDVSSQLAEQDRVGENPAHELLGSGDTLGHGPPGEIKMLFVHLHC